jgi:Tfp pilus assembly protein PilX
MGRRAAQQRGLVLFFALIALVAMSLAAVALVRSVDTSTIISGNLAFRQAATTSGDGSVENAITALTAMNGSSLNPFMDSGHPFNTTDADAGYYSNADDTALNLTASATWIDDNSSPAVTDASGNTTRYIIQRMCRIENQLLSKTNCLFSGEAKNKDGKGIPLPSNICEGPGCPKAGQLPVYRITVRVTGPKNTVSYIQAMAY